MREIKELEELGLHDNEIKVYLVCLNNEGADAKQISKQTNIIRTTVYGILQSLIQKGLISYVDKEGIKKFFAVSPRELLNILDRKKEKIKSIIPILETYQKSKTKPNKVEIFQGINGIKSVTNDIISKPNKIVKLIGIGSKWIEFSNIFTSIYYRKKKERNVKTKTILQDIPEERKFFKEKKYVNSEIKFIKNIDFGKTVTYIYHDKVSFVVYDRNNPRGFIITDEEFHRVQNEVFDKLWKEAKK